MNSCTIDGSVTINQPANRLDLDYILSDVKCFGQGDAYISTQASGGVPPYIWNWQYDVYTSTASNLMNIFAGSYAVHLEDGNDCTFDTIFIVTEPAPISAQYLFADPSCIGNNDGYIDVTVFGGTNPYMFTWDGGVSPVEHISGLIQGTYIVTITDFNECEYELTAVSLEDTDVDCIVIPNAFTPNSDGINDTWIIENIQMFPRAYINVYNRWGQSLFEAKGLDDPWDGTFNGKFVPTGTYIYIIDLFNGTEPRTGTVNVVY
jgi:gliding motility-associated-like protein